MRWPWSSGKDFKKEEEKPTAWADSLNATDWAQYTKSSSIIGTVVLTSATLLTIRLYKLHLRRIPTTAHIKPSYYRKRSLFGVVTSVGDADNFRLYHTPGGRLGGWGWMPFRKVPMKREELMGKTIPIRIAGIDAPELAHWGQEAQPYAEDALQFLKDYVLLRRVRAYIHRRDQYDRVVATVFVRHGIFRRDVGLEMLKRGLATVYEAKSGAEFGGLEEKYRRAEEDAKQRKIGMWSKPNILARLMGKGTKLETPREYKTRVAAQNKSHMDK